MLSYYKIISKSTLTLFNHINQVCCGCRYLCIRNSMLGLSGEERNQELSLSRMEQDKDQSWVLHFFWFIWMIFLLSSGSQEPDVTSEESLLDMWGMQMTSYSCHHQEVELRRFYWLFKAFQPWNSTERRCKFWLKFG